MTKFLRCQSCLLVAMTASLSCAAQTGHTLTGKVIDSKTKEPIPFAAVFLSTTMIGTQTSENGTYTLQNIPPAKYDLMVSFVGYKTVKYPVLIKDKITTVNVPLEQDIKVLQEVSVVFKKSDYRQYVTWFKRYFIGETMNASKCNIVNMEKVNLEFNQVDSVLIATCDEPVEIENRALGYKISYYLEQFRLDFRAKQITLGGTPFFRPLWPEKGERNFKLTKERDRAYYGSMNHFMRALREHKLYANDFLIYGRLPSKKSALPSPPTTPVPGFPVLNEYQQIWESYILSSPYERKMKLKIVYNGESQEYRYDQRRSRLSLPQTSTLTFLSHNLIIHENGYYEDPMQYRVDGYWAWGDKVVAELLPLEYQPILTPKDHRRMDELSKRDSLRVLKAINDLE